MRFKLLLLNISDRAVTAGAGELALASYGGGRQQQQQQQHVSFPAGQPGVLAAVATAGPLLMKSTSTSLSGGSIASAGYSVGMMTMGHVSSMLPESIPQPHHHTMNGLSYHGKIFQWS